MQISRLEIFGFKSFMDRLILPIEHGVTGIVGPNGCGKSNIIDALRWVLGETRAKSLRGGTLEDVIFNGTDKLRPLGLAEVSITLRSHEENFFQDLISPGLEAELFAEEEEKRVVQELEAIEGGVQGVHEAAVDSDSENEEAGELQDTERSQDTGESQDLTSNDKRPALRVVQGALLNATSAREGVNALLADYATLSVPLEEESEEFSDGEDTVANDDPQDEGMDISKEATLLHRFSWLKSANEVQVTRRLYRSGESEYFINRVSCRLKDIKELFRAVGLGARTYTIVAQGEVSRVVTARSDERRRILEEAAGVQGFRERIAAANRRLDDTAGNIERIEDVIKERTRQVNSLKRQAARARNRQALKEELATLDSALYRDIFFELGERSNALSVLSAAAGEERAALSSKMELFQAEEEEARSMLQLVDVEGDDLRRKIDFIKEELNSRARKRSDTVARIKELKAFSLSKETELARVEERKSTILGRRQEVQETIEECREKELELRDEVDSIDLSCEETFHALTEELQVLRPKSKECQQALREKRERCISKKSRFEAISAQIVAASPMQQLKSTLEEESLQALQKSAGDSSLLIDGLTIPERFTRAVQAVLEERAAFLVTESPFDVAREFSKRVEAWQDNERCPGLGVVRAGDGELQQAGSVPFRRLLDEISVDQKCRSAVVHFLSDVYVAESLEAAVRYFETEGRHSSVRIVTTRGEIVTANSYYSFQHEAGLVQLKQQHDALKQEVMELEEQVATLEEESLQLEQSIEDKEAEHQRLRELVSQQKQLLREFERELDGIMHQLSSQERTLEQLNEDEERVSRYEAEIKYAIEEYREELLSVEDQLEDMHSDEEREMHEELRTLNDRYLDLDERRGQQRKALSDQVRAVEDCRRKLEQTVNQVNKAELETQKVHLETENLKERIMHSYGEEKAQELCRPLEDGEERLPEETRVEYQERATQIRNRIQREGDVDPESIERLEEELKSLEELVVQKDDLEKAAVTLRRTIGRLRETSEMRFMETFERVSRNFSRLIPRLFGGGRGALELSDPQNPLDSGLEIIARPPGKKLKSIELLSGGEKALCATALIFALFLERPSPLCVLDEVDAPLDDANLVRFVSLVKEMSTKTQFLVITHNKITMCASDQLVGVTMEQPGASGVLSVSLQEALDHVA